MDVMYHSAKTDLARNTRKIIRMAQRGQTVVIENHGQAEVAIIDISDYYILRALAHYHAYHPAIETGNGLSDATVAAQSSFQEQHNLVVAYYLANEISLSRAAELLDLTWLDLRTRFLRLDVPLQAASVADAQADADSLANWLEPHQ